VTCKQNFHEGLEAAQSVTQLLHNGSKAQNLNVPKVETYAGFKLMPSSNTLKAMQVGWTRGGALGFHPAIAG
jgi:hypothetical protein